MEAEIINGPEGDLVVPANLEALRVAGFVLLRRRDDQGRQTVATRLAFTPEGLEQFLASLLKICSR